jgi:DNA mismatch repair ATPase MutL
MRIKLPVTLAFIFASPCLLAQTAVTGSLADFTRDTAGGRSPAEWGLPQSSDSQRGPGQSSDQSSNQNSSQSSNQNSSQGSNQNSSQSNNQNSNQNSSQGSNQNSTQSSSQRGPGEGSSQPSSGQSGAAGQEDSSKGEPNLPDEGGDGDGGSSGSSDGDGGRVGNSNDGDNGDGNDGGRGRDGNNNDGDNGDGSDGDYKPLDDGDPQYDPTGNEGENQIPSGCAEANSPCAQCVRQAEEKVQFNRRYLHIAWSISHSTLDYANKRIAFGDTVSGIHGAMALSWQLAGKPQIEEAMESLRKTYGRKYRDYIRNIESALRTMADCEAENYSIRDLYQRFGFLYLEFVKARYESPD